MNTSDVATVTELAGLLTGIVTVAIQVVKPLIEMLPGLGPTDRAHDAVLQLLNLALQGGLLVAARLTLPAYADLNWLIILALTFGQGLGANSVYHFVRHGAVPLPAAGVIIPGPLAETKATP